MPSAGRQAFVQPSTTQHHICTANRGVEQLQTILDDDGRNRAGLGAGGHAGNA